MLVSLLVLIVLVIGLARVVDRTLQEDARLRPIRNKIVQVWQETQEAAITEWALFQEEWKEHNEVWLLEDGEAVVEESPAIAVEEGTKPKKKKRSKLFGFVRPFLRGKRKRRKKKEEQLRQKQEEEYQPPQETSGVIA